VGGLGNLLWGGGGGTLCVKINSSLGTDFGIHKGVRQGDPLSPLLFNIVGDIVHRMLRRDQSNNFICGLVSHLVPKGVCILHYADDIVVVFQDGIGIRVNVKLLLYLFENISGQPFSKKKIRA
jgi:hypothetical protein